MLTRSKDSLLHHLSTRLWHLLAHPQSSTTSISYAVRRHLSTDTYHTILLRQRWQFHVASTC